MPRVTESATEARLVAWLKKEGDTIDPGMPTFVVEAGGATIEVAAPKGGILTGVVAGVGAVLPVGGLVAYLAAPEEVAPEGPANLVEPSPRSAGAGPGRGRERLSSRRPAGGGGRPASRKAVENGTPGPTGQEPASPTRPETVRSGRSEAAELPAAVDSSEESLAAVTSLDRESRDVLGELLSAPSLWDAGLERNPDTSRNSLHGTIYLEVDMTDAVNMREHVSERWERSYGVRLSLNHIVVKAAATALREQPALGPRNRENGPRPWEQVNLGVSIFMDDGVVTPVLRGADSLSLVEIASHVARLYERAAEGRFSDSELQGGSLIVTNLGKYGVDAMDLVADPPETPVLGIGRCVRKPVAADDEIKLRWLMMLSLSFDGRTMDGTRAARYLSSVKDVLERPTLLVL